MEHHIQWTNAGISRLLRVVVSRLTRQQYDHVVRIFRLHTLDDTSKILRTDIHTKGSASDAFRGETFFTLCRGRDAVIRVLGHDGNLFHARCLSCKLPNHP